MRSKKTALLIGLLCAALSAGYVASQAKDDKAEVALQAAIKTETVDGDLRSAIEQYKKIAALPGAGRATVATALLRMGGCYEKLGEADSQEARKAYEQVVREYGDQAALAAEARSKLAALTGTGGMPRGSTMSVRRVWANAEVSGAVSADGRFISFTDWHSGGNVAVRDLATGQTRLLTKKGDLGAGGFAEPSMPSPDGKRIAYAWTSDSGRNLCVVGTDGSDPRILRAPGNGIMHIVPIAWSPDSNHLLAEFEKTEGARDMMLVTVADGSSKLLKAVGKDLSPGGEFSPDGRYVAWRTKEGISLFDLQTGTESPLIPDQSKHSVLGWAPDGRHILFSSERAGSDDAWLVAVAGGRALGEPILVRKNWGNRPLGFTYSGAFYYAVFNNVFDVQIAELDPAGGKVVSQQPAFRRGNTWFAGWSPDGRFLASIDGRMPGQSVIVRSMDTGEERELPVGEWAIGPGGLRWTPDGKAVVVPASGPGKGNHLIRIDVQTGQVTSFMPLPALGGWPRFGMTRDGNEVYYLRPQAGLVFHDLRTGQERELIKQPGNYYWGAPSPDGQRVAIAVNSDKSWALLVMPAAGGEPRELVGVDRANDSPFLGSPEWTPDSRYLVFLMHVRGQTGQWQLLRVPVDGGEPQRIGLIAARQLQGVRLHPDGRRVAISDIKVDLEVWVMENFLPQAKPAK